MKHLSAYKSLCLLIVFLMINSLCHAQVNATLTEKEAQKWLKEGKWLSGLKLSVNQPVDVAEFAKQYQGNKAGWDKAIAFLRDTNLNTIATGKHIIDGDNVYAMITEGPAKAIDSVKWEGHQNYIDLHYVIRGKEKIGVSDIASATVVKPYDAAKDVANYSAEGKYYTATPDGFFIFFPANLHRPGIDVSGNKAVVKKLVIKIKVVK